ILYLFVEENLCVEEIVEKGFDEDTVKWILHAVDSNEYKRRQSALSFKVTTRSFGIGRRMPIAAQTEC
ncbi:MAG: NAD+ synthase, partial [candidate division Zixibacteria bacterium]|nr:NAD+ synthase [candidate division Zixibacteria bacterium]